MPRIQIDVPDGKACTGCPCSLILPFELARAEKQLWAYGCALLHTQCRSAGEFDNYAIKHPRCPSLNPKLVITKRRGSSLGGIARAKVLSPERRKEIAVNAAKKRWNTMAAIKRGLDEASKGQVTEINVENL